MNASSDTSIRRYRQFLKDTIRKEVDFSRTPQAQGLPAPPLQKPAPPDAFPTTAS